jgi:hypothetical protein
MTGSRPSWIGSACAAPRVLGFAFKAILVKLG